jgi:DNA-binding response OmpR family regulator
MLIERGSLSADTVEQGSSSTRDAIMTQLDTPCFCPNCGTPVDPLAAKAIKRGAVIITESPRKVTWRGKLIALSPIQAEIFGLVAARGRASFDAIDEVMCAFGASPRTRSIHIHRIREKFRNVGAQDPFERFGNMGMRLVIEPDEDQSTATVVGLNMRV